MSKVYIEREAVRSVAEELIAEFELMFDIEEIDEGQFAYLVSSVNRYITIPPADVAPVVRGEWKDEANEWQRIAERHDYKCPKCGAAADYFIGGYDEWWCINAPNFCSSCGAAMSEEAVRILKERSGE